MIGFTVRRLFAAIPVLLLVSVITFGTIYLVPGDPARVLLGDDASAASIAQLHHELGLDQSPLLRYFTWLGDALRGNLGQSIFYSDSVSSIVGQRAVVSFTLAVYAQLIALVVGLGIGIWAGLRQGSWLDRSLSTAAVIGLSVPNFVFALGLVAVFAVKLAWFPATGYTSFTTNPLASIEYLTLPAIALGVRHAALIARMMRGSLIETLGSDYMLAARARGLRRWRQVVLHGLPNALGPTITVIGVGFGGLISGTFVIEVVFAIPGLGRLTLDSVQNHDLTLLQGVVLAVTTLYILSSLLADIAQAEVNPRVALSS